MITTTTTTPVLMLKLGGFLTRAQLDAELAPVAGQLAAMGSASLIVDAREMTDYDAGARERFVAWNSDHRRRIRRVAIVTDKTLWHMVITAMALASRQTMRAFSSLEAARAWAEL